MYLRIVDVDDYLVEEWYVGSKGDEGLLDVVEVGVGVEVIDVDCGDDGDDWCEVEEVVVEFVCFGD